MTTDPKTLLKYANLQMAAEAFLTDKDARVGATTFGSIEAATLIKGNERSSKFTKVQAAEFILDWEVVEHIGNTATGFSGTLFRAKRSDASRGITSGELVLSFRSTEFLEDNARDNKTFAVTGYSLGGHLATAFGLLRQQEAITAGVPNRVTETYTFNGAGDIGSTSGHATSNAWGLTIKGTVDIENTLEGDFLVKTRKWSTRKQCRRAHNSTIHYKKRSWLSSNLLGYGPKRHVKQRTLGASHA